MSNFRARTAGGRDSGVSLVEVLLASTVAIVLVLSFGVTQHVFIERAQSVLAKQYDLTSSECGVAEIEQAIRMSEAVLTASDGVLELSTRYFVDLDAAEEKVRFLHQSNSIAKEVDEGAGYSFQSIVMENVTGFVPHSLEICDPMSRDDYDPDWTPLNLLAEGPVSGVGKLIKDFVPGDPDWDDSYDGDEQRLRVRAAGASARKTITVTPATPRIGLEAAVHFTPFVPGKQYKPLLYGDENNALDEISVIFDSDQSIRLRSIEGGAVIGEAVGGFNWNNQDSFAVKLTFVDGRAVACVDRGSGYEQVGAISAGTINNKPINFQVNSNGAEGAWDDLVISYPYTAFKVVILLDGASKTFYGGAARRQP